MKHNKCEFCQKHISQRLNKYEHIIKQLSVAKPSKRRKLLEKADCCLIKILCECALNVLKGNISLNKDHIRKLSPHVNTLIKLSKPRNSLNNLHRKQKLLIKKGGFLSIILPALVSTLSGLVGSTVSKLINKE
jgi:hypothetical protein